MTGLWLAGVVVNHVGIYGSKVAEGLSAFQRRSCFQILKSLTCWVLLAELLSVMFCDVSFVYLMNPDLLHLLECIVFVTLYSAVSFFSPYIKHTHTYYFSLQVLPNPHVPKNSFETAHQGRSNSAKEFWWVTCAAAGINTLYLLCKYLVITSLALTLKQRKSYVFSSFVDHKCNIFVWN